MPWTNQGGGNGGQGGWQGGGNRGPWSHGPSGQGGGSDRPPDLIDLLRRGQEGFRQIFPRGLGGGGAPLIALGLLAGWFLLGFYTVSEGEQGVETRFGAFTQLTNLGLNYHWPYPIETVRKVQITRQNSVEVGGSAAESLMLTGDENIVEVAFNVIWDIKSARDYVFNIREPDTTVKAVAESAMREIVGKSRIGLIQTEDRTATQEATKALIQQTLDGYGAGIRIREVQMQRVIPPEPVIDAFQDVQSAKADQNRLINEANAYRNKVVPEARGDAETIRQAAEAYKEQSVAQAQGEAQRFLAILAQYKSAKDVTRKRIYLETLERVLERTNKVVVGGKAGQSVLPYLPLDKIGKQPEGRNAGDQP